MKNLSIEQLRSEFVKIQDEFGKFTKVQTIIQIQGNWKFANKSYHKVNGIASKNTLQKFAERYPDTTVTASVYATTKACNTIGGRDYISSVNIADYTFSGLN